MQGYEGGADADGIQPVQQLRREVQARRRRGDGPVLAGVDGLIVHAVTHVWRALLCDVGRERRISDLADRSVEPRAIQIESDQDLSVIALLRHNAA